MRDAVVCRCEDLTEEDVVRAIREYGLRSLGELKKVLRLGMGPCQGRTCLRLAARILARETGRPVSEIMREVSVRPPTVPMPVAHVAALAEVVDGGEG